MHLWDKGDINYEFLVSYPPPLWGIWGGTKSVKIDQFLKKLHVCKKNQMHGDVEQGGFHYA
jgi:hypothetical protein